VEVRSEVSSFLLLLSQFNCTCAKFILDAILPGLLYEIKEFPGKGKGLFARVPIKAGTEIFREGPLSPVLSRDWLAIEASIMVISEEKRQKFFALHSQCKCGQTPCKETPVMKLWDTNSFMIEPHRNEGKKA
jgi:hypothetical protein